MPSMNKEAAERAAKTLRRDLAAALRTNTNHEELARRLNQVAQADGEVHAWSVLTQIIDRMDRAQAAVGMLAYPSYQDTWSGRGNDANRSWLDGVRYVANRIANDGFKVVE